MKKIIRFSFDSLGHKSVEGRRLLKLYTVVYELFQGRNSHKNGKTDTEIKFLKNLCLSVCKNKVTARKRQVLTILWDK